MLSQIERRRPRILKKFGDDGVESRGFADRDVHESSIGSVGNRLPYAASASRRPTRPRGFLISCAMPADISPRLASHSLRRISSSRSRIWVRSLKTPTNPCGSSLAHAAARQSCRARAGCHSRSCIPLQTASWRAAAGAGPSSDDSIRMPVEDFTPGPSKYLPGRIARHFLRRRVERGDRACCIGREHPAADAPDDVLVKGLEAGQSLFLFAQRLICQMKLLRQAFRSRGRRRAEPRHRPRRFEASMRD